MMRNCEHCGYFPWKVSADYVCLPAVRCAPEMGRRRWTKEEAQKSNNCSAWYLGAQARQEDTAEALAEPSTDVKGGSTEPAEAIVEAKSARSTEAVATEQTGTTINAEEINGAAITVTADEAERTNVAEVVSDGDTDGCSEAEAPEAPERKDARGRKRR